MNFDQMTQHQQLMVLLNRLSVYLQCQPLSDELLSQYAKDLRSIGTEGLMKAIARLKEDPEVWAGRFPLPAKIKSYLALSVKDRAIESARRVMNIKSYKDWDDLTKLELHVTSSYGRSAIVNRTYDSTPTIYAQIRDAFETAYRVEQAEAAGVRIGIEKDEVSAGEIGSTHQLSQEGTASNGDEHIAVPRRASAKPST